jgi:hypothetical protein
MKPGDLRRFKDGSWRGGTIKRFSGQHFMVINIRSRIMGAPRDRTTILIGGQIETGWSVAWIMNNSEAVDESR